MKPRGGHHGSASPPPFVGGAIAARVPIHRRPLPRRLPHLRYRCPSWSGCAYLRRMRSRPKAGSRAIRRWRLASARLAASRTSRNSAFRICRALWSEYGARSSSSTRTSSLTLARALTACPAERERDLVLLLDAYHLRPTGADRVTPDPEEIDIDESEEERADETENASSFASFGLGPLASVPRSRPPRRSRGRSRTSTQPARASASVTEAFIDGATCAALLASFLENGVEKRLRTGEAFAAYLLENAPNRRRRFRETDGKKPTNRSRRLPVTSLAELGVRVAGGRDRTQRADSRGGARRFRAARGAERAEHETRAADAAAGRRAPIRRALGGAPASSGACARALATRARARATVACERALQGPWRPSRGSCARAGRREGSRTRRAASSFGAATELVALPPASGDEARAAMFAAGGA